MEETGIDITKAEIEQILGELSGESEKVLKDSGERVMVDMTFYNYSIKLSTASHDIRVVTEDDFVEARWVKLNDLSELTVSPPATVVLRRLRLLPEEKINTTSHSIEQ